MKKILMCAVVSAAILAVGGCKPVTTGAPSTPQTPYQKAATVMDDFSRDLVSAQQIVISLHNGGAIDAATYKAVQSAFGQVAVYGPQIDALISAQAASPTIIAKVNAALSSLSSIVVSAGALDPATAKQVQGSVQVLAAVLGQLNSIFSGVALAPAPTRFMEVNYGSSPYRNASRAGSGARAADLQPGEVGWRDGEAALRDPRRSRRELRQGGSRFAAVAA